MKPIQAQLVHPGMRHEEIVKKMVDGGLDFAHLALLAGAFMAIGTVGYYAGKIIGGGEEQGNFCAAFGMGLATPKVFRVSRSIKNWIKGHPSILFKEAKHASDFGRLSITVRNGDIDQSRWN